MRDLVSRRTLKIALPSGLAIAATCMPFLVAMTPLGTLRTLRLTAVAPLSIVLCQIGVAWTPRADGTPMMRVRFPVALWLRLLLAGAALALLAGVCVDPLLSAFLPAYFPDSVQALVLSLPWVGLFQPLVFVVGCYAFAARLSGNAVTSLVAVVLGHQGLVLLQLAADLPAHATALLLLSAGTYALAMGWSYRLYGFAGPAVLALSVQTRHFARFL